MDDEMGVMVRVRRRRHSVYLFEQQLLLTKRPLILYIVSCRVWVSLLSQVLHTGNLTLLPFCM